MKLGFEEPRESVKMWASGRFNIEESNGSRKMGLTDCET